MDKRGNCMVGKEVYVEARRWQWLGIGWWHEERSGRQVAGGRRREAGGRRQEAGGRRQEEGGRRKEEGGRKRKRKEGTPRLHFSRA